MERATRRQMKKTYLTLAVVLALPGVLTTDASAYLNPRLGRFMQRDPGAGLASSRIGAAGLSRQYRDGMNLYERCGSSPLRYLDPLGTDRLESTVELDQETGNVQVKIYYVDEPSIIGGIFTLGINYLIGESKPVLVGTVDPAKSEYVRLSNGRLTTIAALKAESDAGGTNWRKFGKGNKAFSPKKEENRKAKSIRGSMVFRRQQYEELDEWGYEEVMGIPATNATVSIDEIFQATDAAAGLVKDLMFFYATAPIELAASVRKVNQIKNLNVVLRSCDTVKGARTVSFKRLVLVAEKTYPKLVGKWHRHHILPQYVVEQLGLKSTAVHRVPWAYHQVLHNHIRAVFRVGKNAPWRKWRKERIFRKLKEIYQRFPLPKGFEKTMKAAGL